MKKILIALAVSALTSGAAVAAEWTEGQPGDVNIGGEIVSSGVKWLWKTGDGLSSFSNHIDEISGRVLNVSVPNDELFLAGKMDQGFKGVFLGNSLIPKVEMTSYDGSVITPNFISGKNMQITVKVKDAGDGSELGTLDVPLAYGAAAASIYENDPTISAVGYVSAGAPGTIFEGLLKPGAYTSINEPIKWSGVSKTEMAEHVEAVMPGKTAITSYMIAHSWHDLGHMNYTSADKASYLTYGAGIEANSTLVMKLNQDVSGRVEWKAPVTITVTYS
ncbi:TPA: F41 fimbrial protein [Escherichia coli]|uniref:F4 family fimbrial subunit n=1 Tax=Escherichia coli TaxID=562 RepID=UPI00132A085B|nr:F41 fimbrial protein [Escherichia coli]EHW5162677.1 F41 fimbrial protein [Escherichia coli]ELS6108397.1 F41 fimbrial protein [Escherichia coli]MXE64300.1 F41 fimbrial protein [Escherichia coli]HEI2375259.1 F41 fimbrial protein [Escherichia coli]HEI2378901.1 F41 fimbrial protein [Escherichia coli]